MIKFIEKIIRLLEDEKISAKLSDEERRTVTDFERGVELGWREALNFAIQIVNMQERYIDIEVPIHESDAIEFEQVSVGERDPFTWTCDQVNITFVQQKEDE